MRLLITVRRAMKRSEMIDNIQLLLETQSHHGTSYRYNAMLILDLIEDIGMEPPLRDKWIEGHECEENSWEPEND